METLPVARRLPVLLPRKNELRILGVLLVIEANGIERVQYRIQKGTDFC